MNRTTTWPQRPTAPAAATPVDNLPPVVVHRPDRSLPTHRTLP